MIYSAKQKEPIKIFGLSQLMMSSIGRYSEIPREQPSSSYMPSSYSKTIRKMSCFDARDEDYPRFSKKTFSTNSLPRPGKNSNVFEVILIPAEEVAAQLTLIDSELFTKIELEELISCGWIKKNKQQIAPHTVAYTRRFNHVSYWVVEEILNQKLCKVRADLISYFVRVSKRLYDLNNLHSLFAVVSALRSASIYRLTRTWSLVSKKDRQTLDKYAEVFSDKDNWSKLREHMDSLKVPCVPYIGVYLTDLVYLSMANPSCSLKENVAANNIFRIVTTYQTDSCYLHLPRDYSLQAQLRYVRYIDELLKFVEDDNFKKSLRLEPPGAEHSLSQSSSPLKFIPGHKKTNSCGNRSKLTEGESNSAESLRHLLDDSLLEKNEDLLGAEVELETNGESIEPTSGVDISVEGCLRRKTLLKNGKKPPMASWQRYWVQVWGPLLIYYSAKTLTGSERPDFKTEPCKMKSINGCLVKMADDPLHGDSFLLADPQSGNHYKFRAGSTTRALVWCRKLRECQKKPNRPTNLIKFDE